MTLIADGAEGEPAAVRHCNAFAEVAFLAATRERNGFDDRAVEIHLHAVDGHDGIELSGKLHRTAAGRQMNFASRQLPIDGESNQRAIGDEGTYVADGVDPALPRELGPEIGVDAARAHDRRTVQTQDGVLTGGGRDFETTVQRAAPDRRRVGEMRVDGSASAWRSIAPRST